MTHADDKPEPGDLPDDAPADLSTDPNDKDDLFLNHLERRRSGSNAAEHGCFAAFRTEANQAVPVSFALNQIE